MIRLSRLPLCLRVACRELRAIATSYAVVLVLMGGVFVYGLLYNYMYAPNVVREVPLAVVDHSHTALSRQYIRWLDATPQVSVTLRAQDMLEARQQMRSAHVAGILYLPRDFEQRLLRDEPAVYPFYASTDAFLYYEALETANLQVMEAMDDAYRTQLMSYLTLPELAAVATRTPVTVVGTSLYNPIEGYGVYLIPSVLMIIIFQTMMMLIAMTSNRKSEVSLDLLLNSPSVYRGGARRVGALQAQRVEDFSGSLDIALSLVCGKALTYAVLYALFALFLVGGLPLIFDIPHAATLTTLTVLLIPYILATALLGLTLSHWFTDPEAPVLLIAFFSIGLIFLSGVSYPLELIPWYWRVVHYLIPAAPAVLAFVKASAMHATLADLAPELITLCLQVLLYLLSAVLVYREKLRLRVIG